jgi:hypothetical protein
MANSTKSGNELTNTSRRRAVKKIVGGVTAIAAYNMLPVKWETPIIEQIFLPAHAQTSGCFGCSLEDPCKITVLEGDNTTSEVIVRVDGNVIPPTAGLRVTIQITPFTNPSEPLSEPTTYQTITDEQGMFTGTYTVAGGPGIDAVSAITTVAGADGPAGCDVTTHAKPSDTPVTTEYFASGVIWNSDYVAVTINSGGGGTFVRINNRISRRWAGSFSSIPQTISLTNTDLGPGCSATGSNSVTINSATLTQVDVTYEDQFGSTTTVSIPAATIPVEPAISGTCG